MLIAKSIERKPIRKDVNLTNRSSLGIFPFLKNALAKLCTKIMLVLFKCESKVDITIDNTPTIAMPLAKIGKQLYGNNCYVIG